MAAAQFLPVTLENEWMFENSYISMTARNIGLDLKNFPYFKSTEKIVKWKFQT